MARDKTDKTNTTPVATPATSATWGVPDWRNAEAYNFDDTCTLGRWRWEFFRRRHDVRAFFDERAEAQYRRDLTAWESDCARTDLAPAERAYILEKAPRKPNDPGFWVRCTPDDEKRFKRMGIFNPRIGNRLGFENKGRDYEWAVSGERGDAVLPNQKLERHHLVIAFSTDRPLEKQIQDAEQYLIGLQKYRHGRRLKRPRHIGKWNGYLRALDAKEAGAKLWEIAAILPKEQGRRDEQAAEKVLNQAKKLQFDF